MVLKFVIFDLRNKAVIMDDKVVKENSLVNKILEVILLSFLWQVVVYVAFVLSFFSVGNFLSQNKFEELLIYNKLSTWSGVALFVRLAIFRIQSLGRYMKYILLQTWYY